MEGVFHRCHEGVHSVDDVHIFWLTTLCCKGAETLFFFGFDVEQTSGTHASVHSSKVFHHIAQAHIVIGILERHIFVAVHQGFHKTEFGISCKIDGFVDAFCAKAHLRCGEIAARSARETHNHRIVIFTNAFQTHGQPFLALERLVVFRICCWLSLSIRVDAEYGKVGIMTGPHPVVLIKTKLCHLLWRIHHKAYIVIALFVESIVTISSEIRHDA